MIGITFRDNHRSFFEYVYIWSLTVGRRHNRWQKVCALLNASYNNALELDQSVRSSRIQVPLFFWHACAFPIKSIVHVVNLPQCCKLSSNDRSTDRHFSTRGYKLIPLIVKVKLCEMQKITHIHTAVTLAIHSELYSRVRNPARYQEGEFARL